MYSPVAADEAFLNALYRGFLSVWTGTAEEDPALYTEEELERYGREVKQDGEGTMRLTFNRQAIGMTYRMKYQSALKRNNSKKR